MEMENRESGPKPDGVDIFIAPMGKTADIFAENLQKPKMRNNAEKDVMQEVLGTDEI